MTDSKQSNTNSNISVYCLEKYTPEVADQIRQLLIQLSRSGKDKGEISESWFNDIIDSPWHDLLVAEMDGKIIGIACLSVVMGAGIRKNAYLEDFVTDSNIRGRGIGTILWEAMLKWATDHGCAKLEFTCGNGRESAQQFYKNHGANVYETNFFRKDL